jgi:hypothetical protein
MNHPPLYTLPFAEVKDLALLDEPLVSAAGYLLSGRDRKFDEKYAYYVWSADVDNAIFKGLLRPEDNPKGAAAPANIKKGAAVAVLNKKGKPFSWSPSAIGDFLTCPAQYAAKRFYVTLPYVESEAMRQGTIEHKHLEDRIAHKTPLPEGYTRGEKKCLALEKMVAGGGTLVAERELAITEDFKFVGWFDKNAWGRCKIDVTAITLPTIFVGDWKTGNVKEDLLQLKINACFLALEYPEAEEFITRFFWLKSNEVAPRDGSGNFKGTQIPELWEEILGILYRMKVAWQSEVFNPRPSGLCRNYCAVTSCLHCGKGGR